MSKFYEFYFILLFVVSTIMRREDFLLSFFKIGLTLTATLMFMRFSVVAKSKVLLDIILNLQLNLLSSNINSYNYSTGFWGFGVWGFGVWILPVARPALPNSSAQPRREPGRSMNKAQRPMAIAPPPTPAVAVAPSTN